MKKSVAFFIVSCLCFPLALLSQSLSYKGVVKDRTQKALRNVWILHKGVKITQTDKNGFFSISEKQLKAGATIDFFLENYATTDRKVHFSQKKGEVEKVILSSWSYNLPDVVVQQNIAKAKVFRRLQDVEETTINAGRKNEVVLLKAMNINKVTNTARQIFSKVVGLTINESSDGGLQLNIGGRGLNPNRTANFNTRQNGYDISADVLGYPESYYTPPAEAVQEIQVIRGASSLQYGTQFGGMINFKMMQPSIDKWHLEQRLSYGSNHLLSSFSSVGGTVKNFSYLAYFNYKQGKGFRPNSKFRSFNGFVNLNYQWLDKHSLHLDWLKYHYVAQQPGGLTNKMFYDNPRQSNRERNWFRVDWNILNLKYLYKISSKARLSANIFGLIAERTALGYRGSRVSERDEVGTPRDLLMGLFHNWGSEIRYLQQYDLWGQTSTLLAGFKYYQSDNSSQQGAGSSSKKAEFVFAEKEFPTYAKRSKFFYPNLNFAFFTENIFKIGKNTSITPGFRAEYIKTQSLGHYRVIAKKGDLIMNDVTKYDEVIKERPVFLFGLSVAHKFGGWECYGNLSQNYRSVTFNDIHSNTPGFAISPTIKDEKGFSSDMGIRGRFAKVLYIDANVFALYYGNRIGEYFHVNKDYGYVERYRDNVGSALSYGGEILTHWDINGTFWKLKDLRFTCFLNTAFTGSRYLASDIPNIEGKKVEFVPLVNLKTGLELAYKGFSFSTQVAYVSDQFADATNQDTAKGDNTYGIFGKIPAYYVWDASLSYKFNDYISLETTFQNITNHSYFTQRATGYPGPGIIPSPPFNFVTSIAVNL